MDNICCKPSYKTLALICFLLAAVTVAAFEQVRYCGFVWDDRVYIIDNPIVNQGISIGSVLAAFTKLHAFNWHQVTTLSSMLDCQLFGLDPYWHHLVNLFFHVVNVLLLFLVLRKMTNAVWCSAFVAALFAVHPLRVESVAWVTERKDVLSGLFFMLTLICYTRYVRRPGVWSYLSVVIFYCLGLMSKQMLVTMPFVLLLLDYWPLRRFGGIGDGKRTVLCLVTEKIPLFILSFIGSIIAYLAITPAIGENLPFRMRMANALFSYMGYISKIVYPAGLAVFYPYPSEFSAWQVISYLFVLAVLTLCVVYLGRQRRYLLAGWLWYLGMLVPVIGIVQTGGAVAMADRFTYLPSIGFFIIIVWGAAELTSGWRWRRGMLGVCGVAVIVVLVICTRIQVKYWRDDIALFGHAVEVTSRNHIARNNLANALVSKGRFEDAIGQYRQMLFLKPDDVEALSSLGATLAMKGDFDEAVKHLDYAIKLDPNNRGAHSNIGNALVAIGRFDDALTHYLKALELNPDYVSSLTGAAKILTEHPEKSELGAERAVKFAEHAAKLTDRRDGSVLKILAEAYAAAGQFDKAEAAAAEAIPLLTVAGDYKQADFVRQRLQTYRQWRQGNR